MKKSPYGKIVTLKADATNVECWNFTDRSTHTLQAGTSLLIEHANDTTRTTCMLVNEAGEHPGVELIQTDGSTHRGYRFIIDNAQLRRLTGLNIPHTRDIVGEIIAFESGDMNDEETRTFLRRLKQDGMLSGLQGHYGRMAARLKVA